MLNKFFLEIDKDITEPKGVIPDFYFFTYQKRIYLEFFLFYRNAAIISNRAANFSQVFDGANTIVSVVALVPEPATYALLGGLLALGSVMIRRRK